MEKLFQTLSSMVEGSYHFAFFASFLWGILSIVLSPCHLASLPLIVGYIDGQGQISVRRAFLIALFFSIGILITIALIGTITALSGRMMGDIGVYGNYIVACLFFMVGLYLLEVIPQFWSGAGNVGMKRKGILGGFLLGLIFGIALGPCTFAYMAPMLGMVFKLGASRLLYGIMLLVAYGIGHCSVIVLAGTFTELVQHYLNWNETSRGAVILKKICGVLVLIGGFYLIYIAR
jgi:cytochrome c-type biogenesis protein